MTKFFEQEREFGGGTEVIVYETAIPNYRAKFALALIERFALIAADANGEDSVGRQKLRLMAPDEIVARACEISDTAMTEFDKRGWMLNLPDPKPRTPRKARRMDDDPAQT